MNEFKQQAVKYSLDKKATLAKIQELDTVPTKQAKSKKVVKEWDSRTAATTKNPPLPQKKPLHKKPQVKS